MGRLPVVSGSQARQAFERMGWSLDHQTGSHMILYRSGKATLSIPNHRELATGLLRGLIRKAEATVDDFIEALK
jgi:predicted RNA binding protein YcfA (HicA-like mRNA interferase family)